jgi:eight-cysteine-cluster-containing protein
MLPALLVVALSFTLGCGHGRSEPTAAPPAPEPASAPAPSDATSTPVGKTPPVPSAGVPSGVVPAGVPQATGAELYGSCRERVEGRETEGECAADSDCVAAGCSGEICLAQEAAKGLMGTCEVLPCFQALDACGCVEGMCRWSIKEGPFSRGPSNMLPVRLPQ